MLEQLLHCSQHLVLFFKVLCEILLIVVWRGDPVNTEFDDAEYFEDCGQLAFSSIEELFVPLCIRGVDCDLLEGEAHWKLAVKVLEAFETHVDVLDRMLHIVKNSCHYVLQKPLLLLLRSY